jgi:hypothetical protein
MDFMRDEDGKLLHPGDTVLVGVTQAVVISISDADGDYDGESWTYTSPKVYVQYPDGEQEFFYTNVEGPGEDWTCRDVAKVEPIFTDEGTNPFPPELAAVEARAKEEGVCVEYAAEDLGVEIPF